MLEAISPSAIAISISATQALPLKPTPSASARKEPREEPLLPVSVVRRSQASAVVVNASGQLGIAASSARFKDEIKPMNNASEAILALRPVTFRYKQNIDPDGVPQFGLVAEEVAKVNPDLVARDDKGRGIHRALRSGERDVAQ